MTGPLLALAPLRLEARALAAGAPGATVVRTGMGARRSAGTAARLGPALAADGAAVAVAGVGGALVEGIEPGDLVVADRVLDHDGRVVRTLPGAPLLARELRAGGATVHVGGVISARRVVHGRAGRAALAAHGAVAVDLETAALLAPHDSAPTVVVRAVSDGPGRELRSPRALADGWHALQALRRAAPALETWAAATGPRRVVLAAPRSFCAGVERAIATVEAALDRFGAPVYVRRHIVHNEHVVAGLQACGAVFVRELDEVPDGATVVFSAHGVAPAIRADAATRGLRVVDATCPLVAKVHAEVRRFARDGRQIVLVGHVGHEEIDGTVGEAPGVRVVATPADVAALDLDADLPVAYATQTTLSPADVDPTVAALAGRFRDLVGPSASDICYATHNRQEAVHAVTAGCDVVIVVGSASSSNSQRLVEVVHRAGGRAELVADETDLDLRWLRDARCIGVTAGASTPEPLVERVVAALGGLGPLDVTEAPLRAETVSSPLPLEVR